MLDENIKAFVIYVNFLSMGSRMTIYPTKKTKIASILAEKVSLQAKYLYFADIFLEKLANILLKQTKAKEQAIKLEQGKQPRYWPIYNLGPVELKTFKTYIKINLANSFIKASKLLADAPILIVCKSNAIFCLYVNYQRVNNFTIKNLYLLLLIEEFLNWLNWAKQFTYLDLINAYH